MAKDLYDLGEAPPLGEVPRKMHAWTVRAERFGPPEQAFQVETVDVPELKDDEVLLYVMAAGVNYNNVWASLGIPVNVIAARQKQGEPEDFHVGGSDAAGIVYKVGKDVTWPQVGDEVVIHCGHWDRNCPVVRSGEDPMYSPTFRTWGFETNYGGFAQFAKVQAHQCLPKPKHLTWEASASYLLVAATAYRMLRRWDEHGVKKDDVVLVWGGAGGLGSMAIQICRAVGAVPIAVVSGEDKIEYCKSLGAKGCINRKEFDHWGMLPHWKDNVGYGKWLKGARAFGAKIWDVLGEKKAPRLIFEHPGETTIPTSLFVCDTGGMVVICAGTTGYNATVDLRYLWMRQKRVQGSHFANDEQAQGANDLVLKGLVDPCLSRAFSFDELPLAHQLMYENKHPHGNMAILIGATEFGTGATAADPHLADHLPLPEGDTHEDNGVRVTPQAMPQLGLDSQPFEGTEEPAIPSDGTRVRDLMHVGLISAKPDSTVQEAAMMMLRSGIHAVVVVENEQAVGILTQTDMVLARQGRAKDEARQVKVRDAMTPECMTCDADTPLSDAIATMTTHRADRIVVTEKKGGRDVPTGILSMTDVIRKAIAEDA
ncbi:MAG: crotonyl-CoA carboxylase/reductase [Alphaproteobacteria bacterium]|jgi:crotonyl-CoA carboxylase/reductase|nr:crotonyl-CoA carboxylase/reductase [Alphaproteobacteria bacterium]